MEQGSHHRCEGGVLVPLGRDLCTAARSHRSAFFWVVEKLDQCRRNRVWVDWIESPAIAGYDKHIAPIRLFRDQQRELGGSNPYRILPRAQVKTRLADHQ